MYVLLRIELLRIKDALPCEKSSVINSSTFGGSGGGVSSFYFTFSQQRDEATGDAAMHT